jgi:choline dehydrogenase-like flavoprotein
MSSDDNELSSIVVGSGPSGVTVSHALLERGRRVLMVDSGLELEEPFARKTRELAASPHASWKESDLEFLKEKSRATFSGLSIKYAFGSDFAYQRPASAPAFIRNGVSLKPSYAKGGFSNVWGSSILPCLADDMHDWPIPRQELDPHYEAVARLFEVVGRHDDLEEKFPLYAGQPFPLRYTDQVVSLLDRSQTHRVDLKRNGIRMGGSRLAFNRPPYADPEGCIYCGLCMYGCPKQIIYSSDSTLNELKKHPLFSYRQGLVVESFQESSSGVSIYGKEAANQQTFQMEGSRLFLAAGVIGTTTIVAKSLRLFDHPFRMKDSQHLLVPLWLTTPGVNCRETEVNTLSEVFVEIQNPEVTAKSVHLQLYSYNEMYRDLLQRLAGPLKPLFKMPTDYFLRHFMVAQGYLHSDDSSSILLRVSATSDGTVVSLSPMGNPRTPTAIKAVLRFLKKHRHLTGFVPMSLFVKRAAPGGGNHSGGTFPMRESVGPDTSDLLGRPLGLQRVHCVDSSVLPSLPATTVTFSVMANAHRIGSLA